ncbi:TPA: PKHD-type hydroxylase YbiX [Klebsiella pneumoniae]|uniref:PKHD-type hydroxylase YbiX n=1 Tax=Klebsiella pneumoniae TaxID=573 RepID=UPI000452166D|nr:PKHD-type hydroxylase YbiX [Klebsiella pneumoniae]AIX69042.1 Fe(II)-dependent oxygenase [Klebsiella pneumoniae subsp. pneumoniae]EIW9290069.1 PKHD-type hydroxylase YbiX [Klebsiella pneumoniae]EKU2152057.1 PKHD-type hydroxylase YbiX [Klebsiella pneumoniae]EKV0525844.1 PKHD-type hydroxylase YbiX [Klebsiella pneumoniae]EKV0542515.1 PKHD-type hydroxylase YbiX [Klebsiella pneumoniae]
MMYHIPDVLSTDQVAEFTRQLAQAEWVDGRVTVGSQGAAVKQNQQIDTRTPLYARLQAAVLDMLRGHPQFFSAALPQTISAPLFNRYGPGETYGFHVDGAVRQNGEAGWMRTDLSATLFLCDPESYEGGELVIEDTYGQHRVKLPAGHLVLYPASSLHCVTPVTRGVRQASFLWIQSMVRDDKQRAMLYDLDRTIQSLKARFGDGEEVLSLLNMYHNLLRQWTEV